MHCRFVSLIDRLYSETFSAATSGTSMYQDGDDDEMEDVVTSRAGLIL